MKNITNINNIRPNSHTNTSNFYPCILNGVSRFVPTPKVKNPINTWSQIGWQLIKEHTAYGTISMMAIFFSNEKIVARASFLYNYNTGRLLKHTYQDAVSFDIADPFSFNIRRQNNLIGESKLYVINLIKYFKSLNDIEYEKAKQERTVRVCQGMAADQFDKKPYKPRTYIEPSYDVSTPKATVYEGNHSTRRPAHYTVETWERRGHYRKGKDGKMIYIKPVILHRRKPM